MQQGYSKEMQELMSSTECNKDFACLKSYCCNQCGAKLIAGGKIVDCSDSDCPDEIKLKCKFRMPFGKGYFCTCPIKLYHLQHQDK